MLNKLITESWEHRDFTVGFRGAFGKVARLGVKEEEGRNTNHTVRAFGQGLGGGRAGNLSKGRVTSYPSSKILFCKHRFYLK